MRQLLTAAEALVRAAALAGVLAYGAAAAMTLADVIGRRVGLPVVGVVDLVQLCVLGGAWLVIPYAFLRGSHVSVDLLMTSLPRAFETTARLVAGAVAIGLLGLMLHFCYGAFQQQLLFGDRSQQLGIPIVWYWVPLLVGLFLSIVACLAAIAGLFRGRIAE